MLLAILDVKLTDDDDPAAYHQVLLGGLRGRNAGAVGAEEEAGRFGAQHLPRGGGAHLARRAHSAITTGLTKSPGIN